MHPYIETVISKLLPPQSSAAFATEVRPWYPVRLLGLYRLFIATLITSLFLTNVVSTTFGKTDPVLFGYVVIIYLMVSCIWLFLIHGRKPGYYLQITLQVFTDIILVVLMMHASGGFSSGLGILLVVNIGGASLLLTTTAGFFFAAFGTILILLEQIYTHLTIGVPESSYPQVAALGAAFFGTAALISILKHRVQESEQLAEQRELDIENLAQLNEHIIQQMQNGVAVVDHEQQIRLLNRAARMQLNIHDDHIPMALEQASKELGVRYTLWQSNPSEKASRIRSPGSPFELQPHFIPLGNEGSAGTLIILEDTTPYSREFQNLKLASLGRLTASIAHEIRNPLSAIQHAAQLLAESGDMQAHDRRLTEIISQQSERMNAIITNIMQLSIKEQVLPEIVQLAPWLELFVQEFRSHYTLSLDELVLETPDPEIKGYFDSSQLHQIVWNLCANALKYGRDKRNNITITLSCGVDLGTGNYFLEIMDTGRGVPPEIQDQIFEPFYSSGNSSPGLGLYIVRELCEFNQARIRYVQRPKCGAIFRIEFSIPGEKEVSNNPEPEFKPSTEL